ncbi:Hsp70 family protein [Haliangium ochraceum]|uniref:Heat shock protein 70 n=1 Tax=Haliangium ochraceum (strain DSM 14365 / JCM 11303 / SMP-2) TaxID=502025 RepID=D0LHM1_HALO1|nr:Hsp70 family protein [Haliangium ochraceum]ACY12883.1 Heat shock protein 70 [Haliangium ochraceum DSM 14365]
MSTDNASSERPFYAGFDLGTTNSAAAVFDGEQITLVRNAQGSALTPSVVRIDGKGRTTVGVRARRYLDSDPDNTRSEFKRLMGTDKPLDFPAAALTRTPQELAAQILGALRADVRDQLGILPTRAVIAVPALFELPQSNATAEAARLAGFERVELLQEPVASALAAGWRAEDMNGAWLVYDIGGGTFDVSLLETRDGLLRVVGHDGDNFLGGRDFDAAVVDWMIERLAEDDDLRLDRGNPEHAAALQVLRRVAEEAKIELSRVDEAVLAPPQPLQVGDTALEFELTLDRDTLERLCAPVVDRSLDVCRRLLEAQGLTPGQVERAVLVGGPTVAPFVRARIERELGVQVSEGHDPMTLVAQGAAIYAATANLDARPEKRAPAAGGHHVWLQYPAVSSDLTPHVVGRVTTRAQPGAPTKLRLVRKDGAWTGAETAIDGEGGFVTIVDLAPRKANVFTIEATDATGATVAVHPDEFTIVQGITISDPPLSRSVGVALASDHVHVYFERGAALPVRRTFTHFTVETVAKGAEQSVLKIPIVQGEFSRAHLCRLVGSLEIGGARVSDTVPSGSPVEVTIELDRGGRLSASALVPATGQVFEEVAHLLVPTADPEVLSASLADLRKRVVELRTEAFRKGWSEGLELLEGTEEQLEAIEHDVIATRGGDEDAGQKARRSLLELDAAIGEVELRRRWPELEEKAMGELAWASDWVSRYGTAAEKQLLEEVGNAVSTARSSHNPGELERQLRVLRRLGNAAFHRHPEAWQWLFEGAASKLSSATDLPKAQALVDQGKAAITRGDEVALRGVVEQLWRLLPIDVQTRRLGFDSGIR